MKAQGVLEAPAPAFSAERAAELARQVADGMREAGVLIGIDGPAANVLKIRPPLAIQEAYAARPSRTLRARRREVDQRELRFKW
ncbi:MAG: hypothetical protein JRH17_16005 [Deltaproteobacteria bacterium]|nr:hypothetical protein [Deltaproteobacteria bacterium]MBW2695718.1 hypothetical protein [Deltaproteobacteria bacterium]